MQKRLPDCRFTADDISAVHDMTGLQSTQIQVWADNLRYRVPMDAMAAYLTASEDDEKVDFSVLYCICSILLRIS
jgi:hypothetical protein